MILQRALSCCMLIESHCYNICVVEINQNLVEMNEKGLTNIVSEFVNSHKEICRSEHHCDSFHSVLPYYYPSLHTGHTDI